MTVPETIDQAARGYSTTLAYWLARASQLVYQDEAEVVAQAQAWGFDRVRHHLSRHEPPFPLEDTQAYTMASDRMIITAFRGTEADQIKDWLSDATTPPWPGPAGTGFVHYGFGEALDSVLPEVRNTLVEFRDNGQSVWFTGHSLGGALAMLAGAYTYLEDPRQLPDGVYTYGQPRTCDPLLAAAVDESFQQRMYRFVNNNDIVPQVPPEPPYAHVEALRYIDTKGKIHESVPFLGGLADQAAGLTSDPFAPASDGIRDHSLDAYVAALEKNLP
ncbi:lipase family protein [Streptomyces sp. B6B3]|uniref:lipase family protein n=1 Tax=Streptomyces sp. B6B3 TaxID=3153570 RepID=UPI00325DF552